MIGYHLSLMTAIRNTGTDFWRRGGGTAKEWDCKRSDSGRQQKNLSEDAEAEDQKVKKVVDRRRFGWYIGKALTGSAKNKTNFRKKFEKSS